MSTILNGPDLTVQQRKLQEQFAEQYRGFLRAAARRLEPDPKTRHEIYRRLNCASEDQP
ncbi:MAG: hypothetical protein Q7S29_02895 [Candidatus Peribacter sp.]|nr:hypothetical protein [Candidatus Peribacter sp.]